MIKRKILAVIMTVIIAISTALPVSALYAPPFEVKSGAVYLYNLTNDKLLYEKNSDKRMYPASLTKIMTVALAIEKIPDPDTVKIAKKLYIQDMLYGQNASNADIRLGEEVTARGLMYASMLQSANEAALMLADYIGDGSLKRFSEMMNDKAKELGCTGTNFSNPNGLFAEDNYTTASDMAKIAKYAMSLPGFMEMCSETSYDIGPTNKRDSLVVNSTIQMMKPNNPYTYAPVKGIKTGTLPESGRCFASTATLDGQTYLMVILGAPLNNEEGNPEMYNFIETKKLYQWVFSSFGEKGLIEENQHIVDIPVELSMDKDVVRLVTASPFATLVPIDVEPSSIQLVTEIPDKIDAPVKKGDKIGKVKLMLANEQIGEVELASADTVERSAILYALRSFRNFFRSFWFKFAFCFILVFIILYIILTVMRNRRKIRSGRRRRSPNLRNM